MSPNRVGLTVCIEHIYKATGPTKDFTPVGRAGTRRERDHVFAFSVKAFRVCFRLVRSDTQCIHAAMAPALSFSLCVQNKEVEEREWTDETRYTQRTTHLGPRVGQIHSSRRRRNSLSKHHQPGILYVVFEYSRIGESRFLTTFSRHTEKTHRYAI